MIVTHILDGAYEVIEEWAGIIYSVGNNTEAILHKIGNWSNVEAIWNDNKSKYSSIDNVLADFGEKYYLLKLPANDAELSGLHNTSRLEGYLIRNGIHPLHRTKRLSR